MPLTIGIAVGSLRRESFNRRLAEALTQHPAAKGNTFAFLEIGTLPLYNQDDDANPVEAVKNLKQQVRAADAVIFVTPEYNRSVPGVLKNAIDHASRPYGDGAWAGKPAAVIGTSPGAIGTATAQQHLRNILVAVGMPTLPLPEACIQWKDDLIGPDGQIAGKTAEFVGKWLESFLAFARLHNAERI